MNVLLSIALWLALIVSSCCGHETQELTTTYYDDYQAVTDYYNLSSIDYSDFPEAVPYIPNKASEIGQLNLPLLLGLAVLQIWD